MKTAGLTDVGNVRVRNEDALLLNDRVGLFVVADGIGGLNDGHVASRTAVLQVNTFVEQEGAGAGSAAPYDGQELLSRVLREANAHIRCRVLAGELPHMGAACLAVLVRDSEVSYAHTGDCKLFLLRAGELRRINQDHTWTRRMVDEGLLSEEEARQHPKRHVIESAVGVWDDMVIEKGCVQAAPGDRFLLSTDGLFDDLDEEAVRQILKDAPSPEACCADLIGAAKARDGKDNLTAVVLDWP